MPALRVFAGAVVAVLAPVEAVGVQVVEEVSHYCGHHHHNYDLFPVIVSVGTARGLVNYNRWIRQLLLLVPTPQKRLIFAQD